MPRPPSKAQHVADQLKIKIAAGEYEPGQWLPARRDLGKEYGVDRGTIGRAFTMLGELLEVVENNGARVRSRTVSRRDTDDQAREVNGWRGFGAAVGRAGEEPYSEALNVGEIAAPSHVARWLGVPIGSPIFERSRIQGVVTADGRQPVQISASYLTMGVVDRVPALREWNTGRGGMRARMEQAGYVLRYEDVVSARLADTLEQQRLRIDERQPVLDDWRRCYDQANQLIEASRRIVNPLLHELVFRYP